MARRIGFSLALSDDERTHCEDNARDSEISVAVYIRGLIGDAMRCRYEPGEMKQAFETRCALQSLGFSDDERAFCEQQAGDKPVAEYVRGLIQAAMLTTTIYPSDMRGGVMDVRIQNAEKVWNRSLRAADPEIPDCSAPYSTEEGVDNDAAA